MREFVRQVMERLRRRNREQHILKEMLILGILRDDGPSDEASIKRHLRRFTENGFSECVSKELPIMLEEGVIERIPCLIGNGSSKWRITPKGWAQHEEWKTNGSHERRSP